MKVSADNVTISSETQMCTPQRQVNLHRNVVRDFEIKTFGVLVLNPKLSDLPILCKLGLQKMLPSVGIEPGPLINL